MIDNAFDWPTASWELRNTLPPSPRERTFELHGFAGIETIAQQYGADEVIVVTITFDHAARRRSYELLAEAFDLSAGLRRAA